MRLLSSAVAENRGVRRFVRLLPFSLLALPPRRRASSLPFTAASRIDWIDCAKGCCIFLVVMLYAYELAAGAAGQGGWLGAVVAFAQPFRMPDFFLLSGLLLGRTLERDWRTYLDRKVVHFAYFYVLWMTALFAFESPWLARSQGWAAVPAAYLEAFVNPYSMLWFIYLLPVFFVVTKLARDVPAAVVWTIAAALQVAHLDTGVKVLDKFAAYYVFFYTGFVAAPWIFRLAQAAREHRGRALAALAVWALVNGTLAFGGYSTAPLVSLALGLAGAVALTTLASLACRLRLLRPFAHFGEQSLVIYVAFAIPMAVTRELLERVALVQDVGWVALLSTLGGIGGALIAHALVKGTRLRFLFERPRRFGVPRAAPLRAGMTGA